MNKYSERNANVSFARVFSYTINNQNCRCAWKFMSSLEPSCPNPIIINSEISSRMLRKYFLQMLQLMDEELHLTLLLKPTLK